MTARLRYAARAGVLAAAAVAAVAASASTADQAPLPVSQVADVGFTVSNMDRALDFYTRVLPFTVVSDIEASGRQYELLTGVFAARARVVRLRLGEERLELTEFHAPRGRPIPDDMKPNDRAFQHVAIVVRDMDAAYRRLRAHAVEHASSGPQTLPEWNRDAAGIRAFYFRDPDRHFLEVISFPPGKGPARWQAAGPDLFLGIDHTAIVVGDTEASLAFYRDTLGLKVAGGSENHGIEQEHLNGVFGARLRITTLRAAGGPGIELLEYLAPRDGRAPPADLRANDVGHWQTTLVAGSLAPLLPLARGHRVGLVSPGPIAIDGGLGLRSTGLGFRSGALVRDPDGHGMRVVVP